MVVPEYYLRLRIVVRRVPWNRVVVRLREIGLRVVVFLLVLVRDELEVLLVGL